MLSLTGLLRHPSLEMLVLSDPVEISVGGEQPEFVPDAELGQDGVDRADLDSAAPSTVAKLGSLDVVVSIGVQEGGVLN